MSIAEFREKCKEFALEQVELQKQDFKRLGVRGDFNNPYITLKPEYEAAQIRLFGEMADKGLIYKGKNLFIGHHQVNLHLLKLKLNITINVQHLFM